MSNHAKILLSMRDFHESMHGRARYIVVIHSGMCYNFNIVDSDKSDVVMEKFFMKKPVLLISTMYLVLSLTACSGDTEKDKDNVSNQNMQTSTVEEESKNNEEKETPDDTISSECETEADTAMVSEEIAADPIIDGLDMDNPPVNWGTPDGPEIAAENYYKNTVFELVSLDVLQSSKDYVLFSVVSKKGGKLVDPNRTIELRFEDGKWNVVNEGY